MTLKYLHKQDLLTQFSEIVKSERKITAQVLEYIAEIDTRRLYLDLAFGSLFDFLVKGHGYSPSSAQRRIAAARLLREAPKIAEQVEAGKLNLSQLAMAQTLINAHQKESCVRLETDSKLKLLEKISGATHLETEVLLTQELGINLPKIEKQSHHRDESVTLTITFSKEQIAILREARELCSHSVPDGKWAETLAYLGRKEIQRKKGYCRIGSKSASSGVRKNVLRKFACCQFTDPITGRKCDSRVRLQVDHLHPRWDGGGDRLENLSVLCALHNRHKYQLQAGIHPA